MSDMQTRDEVNLGCQAGRLGRQAGVIIILHFICIALLKTALQSAGYQGPQAGCPGRWAVDVLFIVREVTLSSGALINELTAGV